MSTRFKTVRPPAVKQVKVSNRILDLLAERHMTQNQLADAVNVSSRQLHRIVHHEEPWTRGGPSLVLAMKIAQVLGEPIDRVFPAKFNLEKAA
jgi:DNA-binding XRE family transcriptional regulator